MSTRGNICIRIQEEDYDRVNSIISKYSFRKISKWSPYLYIYNHFDSYPESLGKELLTNYNNYNKALELVLEGDCSYPGRPYKGSEEYSNVVPKVAFNKVEAFQNEFLYVFNKEWECYNTELNKINL